MFFQNVFDSSFRGSLLFADRQYNIDFNIGPNKNRSDLAICWNKGPFNLSGKNTFIINFSSLRGNEAGCIYYTPLTISLPNSASVTAQQIIDTLNANANFSSWFVAEQYNGTQQFAIKSKEGRLGIKFYFPNNSCTYALGMNKNAPVAELLDYYERYTFALAPDFPGCIPQLLVLDPGDPIDANIITDAGFNPLSPKEDWQLLQGKVETFKFVINTYDGSNRLDTSIEFFAGAVEGNLGRKTVYEYDGASTRITGTYQIPHVLTSSDVSNTP